MNLIERIAMEMESDAEDLDEQSEHLRLAYEGAEDAVKTALDTAFIALCGYSLASLIAQNVLNQNH